MSAASNGARKQLVIYLMAGEQTPEDFDATLLVAYDAYYVNPRVLELLEERCVDLLHQRGAVVLHGSWEAVLERAAASLSPGAGSLEHLRLRAGAVGASLGMPIDHAPKHLFVPATMGLSHNRKGH